MPPTRKETLSGKSSFTNFHVTPPNFHPQPSNEPAMNHITPSPVQTNVATQPINNDTKSPPAQSNDTKSPPEKKDQTTKSKENNSNIQQYQSPPRTVNLWLLALVYLILCIIMFLVTNTLCEDAIIKRIMDGNGNNDLFRKIINNDKSINLGNFTYLEIWKSVDSYLTYVRVIVFLVLFVILYFTNYGFIYKVYLGGSQDNLAFQILALCFISIMGILFLLCNNVEFIKIFENTVGYNIISSLFGFFFTNDGAANLDTFMTKILKSKDETSLGIHYGFLLTVFRLDNLGTVFHEIYQPKDEGKYPFEVNGGTDTGGVKKDLTTDTNFIHLLRLITKKHMIGHFCWVFIGSFLSTLVASKYLAKYL